jgi:predicted transcriptional regulator
LKLDLSKVDREAALKAWLTYHKIGYAKLASKLGVDTSFISYLVRGKRKSRRLVNELIAMGVPAELLREDRD